MSEQQVFAGVTRNDVGRRIQGISLSAFGASGQSERLFFGWIQEKEPALRRIYCDSRLMAGARFCGLGGG